MKTNQLLKNAIVFSMVACASLGSVAQQRKSATMYNYNKKMANDKKFAEQRIQYKKMLEDWTLNQQINKSAVVTTTIPVNPGVPLKARV